MSRKKAGKAKSSPSASPKSRESAKRGRGAGSAGDAQPDGAVRPSRPSLSSSGEFYDLAFKVRCCSSVTSVVKVAGGATYC